MIVLSPTDPEIYAAACRCLTLPICHHGRDRVEGVDCVGLVTVFLRDHGIEVPEAAANLSYDLFWFQRTPNLLYNTITRTCRWPSVTEVRPLDVLLFGYASRADHLAVYLGGPDMLHAYRQKIIVESLIPDWNHRLVGAFRPGA